MYLVPMSVSDERTTQVIYSKTMLMINALYIITHVGGLFHKVKRPDCVIHIYRHTVISIV